VIDSSYAIARYPTLRIQRHAWPLVPLAAAICSVVLCVYTWCNSAEYAQVCSRRITLLQQASTPLDLERARYLLDKTNCNVRTELILEIGGHQAACEERLTLLRQAATSVDLERARYLLDKANCDVSTQLILAQLPQFSPKNIPRSVP